MKIIFDLDGTLALVGHRRHLAKAGSWDEFFQACIHDEPNQSVIYLLDQLRKDPLHEILIWSGRSDVVKDETVKWLKANFIHYDELRMRKEDDFTPDDELKESWLNSIDANEVLCVFDDRDKVVDMWRKNGLLCCQVAPGDF